MTNQAETPKKHTKHRNDLILVGAILLLAAFAFGVWQLFLTEGDAVAVLVDGVEIARYPLSVDREVPIETEGGGFNLLVIRDGRAYMREANCPDGICARHNAVSLSSQTIVCLPHKLVIRVIAEEDDRTPDVTV